MNSMSPLNEKLAERKIIAPIATVFGTAHAEDGADMAIDEARHGGVSVGGSRR
jgi:hypothetical protein